MDVHSTHVALENGARELNPRIAAILAMHGLGGFVAFKVALLGLVYVLAGSLLALHARARVIVGGFLALSGAPAWLIAGSNYNVAGWLP